MKNKVKDFRIVKNLTQQDLADVLNVSRQMISYIENGDKKPNIILALKIAEFFNKSVEEIFELEKED